MITTLADLVAPMTEEALLALLRAREPMVQRGGGSDGRYSALITWDSFLEVIAGGSFPASGLRLTQRGALVPEIFFRDGDKPRAPAIRQVMATGGSAIAYGIDPSVPALATLCADAARRTGDKVYAVVIGTAGGGGALAIHFDVEDIVVVQIEGSKRWLLYPDPAPNPVLGMPLGEPDEGAEPVLDVTLDPGDLLFVPAGYRHRCENRNARSLHAGILFYPLTAPRVLDLLRREMLTEPQSRAPVRTDSEAAEAALKEMLIARIRDAPLAALRARHREVAID